MFPQRIGWRGLQSRPLKQFLTPKALYTVSARRRQEELTGAKFQDAYNAVNNPQTLTEKIVQRYSLGLPADKFVKSGDYVVLSPHHCMTHDNSWPVALKFMSIGATKIHDKKQIVMTLDHDVQNKSDSNLRKYQQIEEFASNQGVDFYPAGRGIGHQIMVEEGYAWPGTMTVASDSHSNMYGGVGCLGTPMVRTDAASIWATGQTWWQIPPVAKITFTGVLPKGVTGKDVIVALCGLFNNDEATTSALFDTPVEGVIPRISHPRIDDLVENRLEADGLAKYAKSLYLNLSTLSPYIAGPNSVKVAKPLKDLEAQDIKINKAYLVSCTNSRSSDLAAAAKVFKDALQEGKEGKIKEGVQMYIAAASIPEQKAAEENGDWQALIDAGAIVLPAGCGPCIGLGTGLLEAGEVGISASNRNFKGRMGSTEAKAYLASPEVVAASAMYGKIAGPGWYEKPIGVEKVVLGEGSGIVEKDKAFDIMDALDKLILEADDIAEKAEKSNLESASEAETAEKDQLTEIEPGFPEQVEGEIVFCDADNINTDGIYPGKYTYQDNVTTEKMAEYCMENYDKAFGSVAREGDILVSGFNFGCGSSREQAATAILSKKIPMVVAGSFGNIFSRNSINNALMAIEGPKLVQRLREAFSSETVQGKSEITEPAGNKESLDSPIPATQATPVGEKVLTRRTGWKLKWDVRRSQIVVTEADGKIWIQKVGSVPVGVQKIIALGGLEKWVKHELTKKSS